MSSAFKEPLHWSRLRWIVAVALVMGIQLILLLRFSSHSAIVPRPARQTHTSLLVERPPTGSRLAESLALNDPTLFALVNPQGFSGEAWLNIRPWEHSLTDWSNPPFWLKASTSSLGGSFVTFVRMNATPMLSLAEKPVSPPIKFPLLGQLSVTQSTLRVEGNLAQRPLAAPLELPPQVHQELLSNSVVRVMVDRAGRVLSHTLVSSSGSSAADRSALALAKAARFQPLRPSQSKGSRWADVTAGELWFQWFTLGTTNTGTGP
jgi:TonB family protein